MMKDARVVQVALGNAGWALQEKTVPAEAVLSLGTSLPKARQLAALANAMDSLAGVIERAAQVSRAGAEDARRKGESPRGPVRQTSKRGRRSTAELAAEGLAQNTERYAHVSYLRRIDKGSLRSLLRGFLSTYFKRVGSCDSNKTDHEQKESEFRYNRGIKRV